MKDLLRGIRIDSPGVGTQSTDSNSEDWEITFFDARSIKAHNQIYCKNKKALRKKINDDISLKVQWRCHLEMDVNYTARKDNI